MLYITLHSEQLHYVVHYFALWTITLRLHHVVHYFAPYRNPWLAHARCMSSMAYHVSFARMKVIQLIAIPAHTHSRLLNWLITMGVPKFLNR